jgi:hypothetical protein
VLHRIAKVRSKFQALGKAIFPLGLWLIFFGFEVSMSSEFWLTTLASVVSMAMLYLVTRGERWLYAIGVTLGLVIEVGLGQIARMQHWENASLFGVPFWLPLVWGVGFVAIRSIGNFIVETIEPR